jgi:hypothetical protein
MKRFEKTEKEYISTETGVCLGVLPKKIVPFLKL